MEDHCNALLKILNKGKIGEFYNIGSGLNYNNLQIVKMLIKIAKLKLNITINNNIKFVKDRPAHDLRYAINSDKIKNEIKWKAKTKLYEGLKKTFNWYLKNSEYYFSINKKDITNRRGLTK